MSSFTPNDIRDMFLGRRDHGFLMRISNIQDEQFMALSRTVLFREFVSREVQVTWGFDVTTMGFIPDCGVETTIGYLAKWAINAIYINNLEGFAFQNVRSEIWSRLMDATG